MTILKFLKANSYKLIANKKGFTLLELIIVIGMMAAVLFVVSPYLGNIFRTTYTEGAARVLISDLKATQSKAMSGIDGDLDGTGDLWGVCIRNSANTATIHPNTQKGCYEIFSGLTDCPVADTADPNYAAQQAKIKTRVCLPGGISFTDPANGNDLAIIFNKIEGSNYSGSTDTLRLASGVAASRIGVTSGGDIALIEFYVTTFSASGVTNTEATLNARANPAGQRSTGWFRYWNVHPGGCSDVGGTRTPVTEGAGSDLGFGVTGVSFSQTASPLSSSTKYYFCAIVKNEATGEKIYGFLGDFTTAAS